MGAAPLRLAHGIRVVLVGPAGAVAVRHLVDGALAPADGAHVVRFAHAVVMARATAMRRKPRRVSSTPRVWLWWPQNVKSRWSDSRYQASRLRCPHASQGW